MTDALTDAVARLKELQADVERLKSGQDEEGEPRLFFSESEIAVAVETANIIREDILERDTGVLDDADSATLVEETVAQFVYQQSGDENGWGTLEYPKLKLTQEATVKTVDIDTTGQKQQLGIPGDVLVRVDIEATAQADFELRGSADGQNILNTSVTFTGGSDYTALFRYGDAFLHIFVTDPAGSGETATITIQEARTE